MQATVLVVDDQASVRHYLGRSLEQAGYGVLEAETGEEALRLYRTETPEVILLDLMLPETSGLEILKKMKEISRSPSIVMVTAHGDVASAVEAMKLGAADYIQKPVNMDHLMVVVGKAMESQRLWMELSHWRKQMKEQASVNFVMGPNPRMQEVYRLVEQVARSKTTSVLIQGESGTGKEHVAQVVHCLSPRRDGPFLELNCSAIPEELLESELFGHEKGAFTDAQTQKKGLLELADGGTLFLDEVGEMSHRLQPKFLRVLETMTFRRVGGTRDIKVDVRIISATNKNLEERARGGSFREDLFYRLKVVPIYIPALRERPEDVLILAKHFIHQFNLTFGKSFQEISPEAARRLQRHPWPGNVRELRNVIERVVLLNEGEVVEAGHLPIGQDSFLGRSRIVDELEEALRHPLRDEGVDLEGLVYSIEKELVEKALAEADWNQTQAARLLRINRDKLRYRVKIFSLERSPAYV
jgi:two-component system response regulator AtoC